METVLWIAAGLLAFIFLMAGSYEDDATEGEAPRNHGLG